MLHTPTTDDVSMRDWCPECGTYTFHDERWYERHQMEVPTCCNCGFQVGIEERTEWSY